MHIFHLQQYQLILVWRPWKWKLANSADQDQMPWNMESDQGLPGLQFIV